MFSSISSFFHQIVSRTNEDLSESEMRLMTISQSQEIIETNVTQAESTSNNSDVPVQTALCSKIKPEYDLILDLCLTHSTEGAKDILTETRESLIRSIKGKQFTTTHSAGSQNIVSEINKLTDAINTLTNMGKSILSISSGIKSAKQLFAEHTKEEHLAACIETMIDDEEQQRRFSQHVFEHPDYGSTNIKCISGCPSDPSLFLVLFKNGDTLAFSNRIATQGELRGANLRALISEMKFDSFSCFLNELYLSPYDALKTCILALVQLEIQALLEQPFSSEHQDFVLSQFNHEQIGDTLFTQLLEKHRQRLKNEE